MAIAAPAAQWTLVASHPHDPTAFTEGLAIANGKLYESTGLYGESRITVRPLRGRGALTEHRMAPSDFGEGLAVTADRIVQLTWQRGLGYVYDLALKPLGEFRIGTEGWGLAWTGRELVRSDGSSTLRVLDPTDYRETRRIEVRDGEREVRRLNELEWADGRIWANVWTEDRILAIDADSGRVTASADLSSLKTLFPKPADWDPNDNCLNGIAWDPASRHYFVTGKRWPKLYEITIRLPASANR